MNKAEWRLACIERRLALTDVQWAESSARIRTHLNDVLSAEPGPVLAYLPFRNEPDLSPLFDNPGRIWGIPRVVGKDLAWHRYDPGRVGRGRFGLPEPEADCEPIDPVTARLVLIPALACDRRGYRLGYGGGYYDRFLDIHPLQSLGVCFGEFRVDVLPEDPWDRRLDGVVTEAGVDWQRSG